MERFIKVRKPDVESSNLSGPILFGNHMIKAIIFDIGGVIITGGRKTGYNATIKRLNANVSRKLGVDPALFETVRDLNLPDAHKGLITKREYVARIASAIDVGAAEFERVWKESFYEVNHINQKAMELASALRANGYTIALLSNITSLDAVSLKGRGVYRGFSPVILSCEVGMVKPETRIYRYALRELGMKAEECMFIDDTKENIAAAKRLGFHAILFKTAADAEARLRRMHVNF